MEEENPRPNTTGIKSRQFKNQTTGATQPKQKPPPSSSNPRGTFPYLSTLPEFSELPVTDLKNLADACSFSLLHEGEYIAHEGDDESARGFIVVTGCLAISKSYSSGRTLIVELLQANDVFGLMLMLSEGRGILQLSAKAIEVTTILWMPKINYLQTIKRYPELLTQHVAHLLRCLHSSYRLARGLAHDKVEVRIASILSSLFIKFGNAYVSKEPGTIHFTRQQLAELTGTTPETAIRITRAMQRQGILRMLRPGEITILDIDSLNRIAEDW
jgi:CRP-like cAMP-binding protein